MPVETKKVEDLPIVIATYTGHISVEEVEEMYLDTERLLADACDRYYRISDVRRSDTTFPNFIKISAAMQQEGKFRTGDPSLTVIFVGTHMWIHNYRAILKRQGIETPTFHNMKDAMAFVKLDLSRNTQE